VERRAVASHLRACGVVRLEHPSKGAPIADVLRVLSIDGGGIRGVIPATVLAEIETRTQARIAELFDLIAGTSTGGVIALGLVKPSSDDETRPQFAASELVDLYEKEGHRIFARSPWHHLVALDNLLDEKYESVGIESVLKQYFGDVPLSKAVTETLITSYELRARDTRPLVLRAAQGARRSGDF